MSVEKTSKGSISLIIIAAFLVLTIFGGFIYRAAFYTFVDNYEYAYMFNGITGEMKPLVNKDGTPKQGYIYSLPIIQKVHTIDTRPMQVCINANSRVLNCKLVQFDPQGFSTFVSWHGRGDYSQMNLEDILKSYAYDPSSKPYPFLKVLKELKNEEVNDTTSIQPIDTTQSVL
jgi:hypothetical protein